MPPAQYTSLLLPMSSKKPHLSAPQAKLELSQVIGNSIQKHTYVAFRQDTQEIAYIAGSAVVLNNMEQETQSFLVAPRQPRQLTAMTISPNGRYVAAAESGSTKPRVLGWDLSNKALAFELVGHKFGVAALAFSPTNSKLLCSIGNENEQTVNFWDVQQQQCVATLKVSAKLHSCKFSPDGDYLITAGSHGHLQIWSLAAFLSGDCMEASLIDCKQIQSKQTSTAAARADITFCDVHPHGKDMLALSSKGVVYTVNFASKSFSQLYDMKCASQALTICQDIICVSAIDGKVFTIQPDGSSTTYTFPKSLSNTSALPATVWAQLSSTGTLYCFYDNKTLIAWDTLTKTPIKSVEGHDGSVWGLDVLQSSSSVPAATLVSCSTDSTLKFWDLQSGELLQSIYEPGSCIKCLSTSENGRFLAVGDRQGNLRIYDLRTMESIFNEEAHDAEILALAFNGPYLASGSRDRLVHIFKYTAQGFVLQSTFNGHSGSVTSLCFTQKGDLLTTATDKSIIHLKFQKDGSFVRLRQTQVTNTIFDMKMDLDDRILTGGQDKKMNVLDLKNGKVLRSIQKSVTASTTGDDVLKLQLDPSGLFLASSCQDKSLRLFHLQSGEMVSRVAGHSDTITAIRFSADCKQLITSSSDGCIFVWTIPMEWQKLMQNKKHLTQRRQSLWMPAIEVSTDEDFPTSPTYTAIGRARTKPETKRLSSITNNLVDELPLWSKKLFPDTSEIVFTKTQDATVRGKWAKRVPQEGFTLCKSTTQAGVLVCMTEFLQDERRLTIDGLKVDVKDLEEPSLGEEEFSTTNLYDSLNDPVPFTGRKSLSAKFFSKQQEEDDDVEVRPLVFDDVPPVMAAVPVDPVLKEKEEKRSALQLEVERTRQRLEKMGIYIGKNKSKPTVEQPVTAAVSESIVSEPVIAKSEPVIAESVMEEPTVEPKKVEIQPIVEPQPPTDVKVELPTEDVEEEALQEDMQDDFGEDELAYEYEGGSPLSNLELTMHQVLDDYELAKSQGRNDETMNHMTEIFLQLKSRLDQLFPTPSFEPMLELYSNQIVQLVQQKLKTK